MYFNNNYFRFEKEGKTATKVDRDQNFIEIRLLQFCSRCYRIDELMSHLINVQLANVALIKVEFHSLVNRRHFHYFRIYKYASTVLFVRLISRVLTTGPVHFHYHHPFVGALLTLGCPYSHCSRGCMRVACSVYDSFHNLTVFVSESHRYTD